MVGAQITFRKVVDSTIMQIIDNEWVKSGANALHTTSPSTTYKNFKEYFCRGLHEYPAIATKGFHAYAVDALTASVDQLRTEADLNRHNVSTIASSTQDQMLAQPEANSTPYVPSVVSISATTTPSGLANSAGVMEQSLDKLDKMFQQYLQQQANTNNGHRNGSGFANNKNRNRVHGDPNGPWRQWTYWYYSYGTNVSHNSMECH
uniref:Uncharacterized protein n=1 Tax=Pseudo-nitzschia australis TaxID=44445 RepID=A0A7S4EJ73_9STRA|mmetsp:Transcript_110/g.160  ORF Transcript_110/g.160 Transcript_110/m.160 type:complete len:205 (+) Transcript_110:112-726(+)|eukprot:CAMPEP_0168198378 /NCGR_PEP_ID=MMETSP0139_2-20121125/21728_1 /TAXON_ID=44445 /ORGANISM="Pseudo-nitzschia australis, Strain 10249 10 AB" /LENGTH=204 /DNA_ID=CAMNT_0008123037 /DNA_START=51 /DNA_END=665 /DNA_ORIENTATION=+